MSLFRHVPRLAGSLCGRRLASTAANVKLTSDDSTGVSTLTMLKKPVNSLSLEMLTDLSIALDKCEDDRTCKAIVLTSALPNVFSAGLDILEMYRPEPERLRVFWQTLQDVYLKLTGCNKVTVAAINGNSPAGGCLLSLCCDYRLMVNGPYAIGLNETKLGIVAPFWFCASLQYTVGQREAEKALMLGTLYPVEQAKAVGLVDELVEPEQLLARATGVAQEWLQVPATARILTKQQLRAPILDSLQRRRDDDVDNFVNFTLSAPVQKSLERYMEALRAKGKK